MADLEANMMHFQLMHESLSRFSESFASFLYGLNMNAFCVDFPEGPVAESFRRDRQHVDLQATDPVPERPGRGDDDGETTFMTTDTPFSPGRCIHPRDRRWASCGFRNTKGSKQWITQRSRGSMRALLPGAAAGSRHSKICATVAPLIVSVQPGDMFRGWKE
ncbi:hypothetical protein VD0002_g5349 [Verticillium dahliae]|nr:hypothetical protein VD0003_g6290 [Verticillium dahliae]PNH62824.1 hypothetical protein VD0002_g5349 [Verticillium dahliae]